MKDFGSLVIRGIVGAVSIVTTAVISVFVQRYFNSMGPAASPPGFVPPAVVAPVGNEPDGENTVPFVGDRPVVLEPPEPAVSPEREGDRSNAAERSRVLQEFWQKLNR
jgi:hypothetical protein